MFVIPPVRYILPNLFTLAATLCGFGVLAICTAEPEANSFYLACCLIPLACFLDGMDGRVARLVHGESEFGVQFDSLSDFATFGMAPAVLIYTWALHPLGSVGVVISFLFAAASMTRLARFNVQSAASTGPGRYFTGLPAPMGGMAVASIVALETGVLHRDVSSDASRPAIAVLVVLVSLLMVSTVRFRTFKDVRFTSRNRMLIVTFLASLAFMSVFYDPMFALSTALVGYLSSGLLGSMFTLAWRTRPAGGNLTHQLFDGHDDEDDEHHDDDDPHMLA
jgi:CDP-diacylglycerol--serine O-phosphatidyltransferase